MLLMIDSTTLASSMLQIWTALVTHFHTVGLSCTIPRETSADSIQLFPDDVTPDGGVPQEGAAFSYSPAILTVSVGGRHAYVR